MVLAVAALAAVTAGACAPEQERAAPTDPCRATIDRAGTAAEISEQVELLDTALVVCDSAQTFAVHVQRHPTLLGWDVATYLSNRCTTADTDAVRDSRICASDVATTTTSVAPLEVPEVVYVGRTLDGREVEIRPRAGRPFVDGKPGVIEELASIAAASGCEGVEVEYDRWSAQVDDDLIGDEASVYAQHALDVLAYIQCDS